MPTYQVLNYSVGSGIASLTLDSVRGLSAGYDLVVEGVGLDLDGTHSLVAVSSETVTVEYSTTAPTTLQTDSAGAARLPIAWATLDDVINFVGLPPAEPDDDTYLLDCVTAAAEWAFERRLAAGYNDRPHIVPNTRVKEGVALYAGALYRERGSVDSFSSFQGMEVAAPTGSMGQINRLLGLQRPAIA